ncbi:MAG: 50S ribosomal protein L19e [Candidatus Aenigmatarchaeota archaeon]
MDLKSQKRVAAQILKCGVTRVRVEATKEVEEALTREDIRGLIKKGLIKSVQKKGTSRAAARKRLAQKRKGRQKGTGSRKGTYGARTPQKGLWIRQIKSLRKLLRELRDSGRIDRNVYRKMFAMAKGGFFRNRKHLLYYLKDHELLKTAEKPKPKPKAIKPKKPRAKKPAKKAKPTKPKPKAIKPKKVKK